MSIKSNILKELEKNKDKLISGSKLAKNLNVSRTSIWKYIEELREEGYEIKAIPNKGYSLSSKNDLISAEGISNYLKENHMSISIHTFKSVTSTNEIAKPLALEGAPHGTVVIAEEQTAGKGRMGRSFYSPSKSGIYMSIILRPNLKVCDSVLVTTAASVAICKAIENITNIKAQIKWINDIVINYKKVCGILTEAVTDFETGNIQHIIIGIGINFTTEKDSFPLEIQPIATSLFNKENCNTTRNHLCAEIINEILFMINEIKNYNFINEYKARSIILNEKISFTKNGATNFGTAIDINDDGSLVVAKDNGETVILNTGEISIRRIANTY